MPRPFSRRTLLAHAGAGTLATLGAASALIAEQPETEQRHPTGLRYCLNTSTIRGQKLDLAQEIDLAGRAGYDAIEPWIGEIHQYLEAGGTTADLRRRIEDVGLTVESAIGFAEWIVDDPQRRAAGLEQARRDMQLVRELGGTRIAAPPAGATRQNDLDLRAAAERYHELLEVGRNLGVLPQLELWGFSQSLSRLSELMYVAVESGHREACVLPDVYHIFKGGSDFAGLQLINGSAIHVFHMNDYPADPPRATIRDADRVYPGDGVAPLSQILRDLARAGFRGVLSLELFNPTYYQQDPALVARVGLEKMRDAVQRALG